MKKIQTYRASTPIIAIKIVGFLDFKTGIVYTNKIISEAKKAANEFVEDFAKVLKGEALRERLLNAKKVARNWTFARYSEVLTACRLIKLFNSGVCSYLRVKI